MDNEFAYSFTIPGKRIVLYESTPRESFLGPCVCCYVDQRCFSTVATKMLLLQHYWFSVITKMQCCCRSSRIHTVLSFSASL